MKFFLPAAAAAALLLGATALQAAGPSTEGGTQGLGTPGSAGIGSGTPDYGAAPNTPGASDYAPGRMNDYGPQGRLDQPAILRVPTALA